MTIPITIVNNKVMVGGEKRERDKWANPSLANPICRCVIQPNTTQYADYSDLEKTKKSSCDLQKLQEFILTKRMMMTLIGPFTY